MVVSNRPGIRIQEGRLSLLFVQNNKSGRTGGSAQAVIELGKMPHASAISFPSLPDEVKAELEKLGADLTEFLREHGYLLR